MSDDTKAPGGEAVQGREDGPMAVQGYLAENWTHAANTRPAVIVNPEAKPLDLLAWCWGEVYSLRASIEALTCGTAPLEVSDLSAIFQHRMQPLSDVLDLAINQLVAEARAVKENRTNPGLVVVGKWMKTE